MKKLLILIVSAVSILMVCNSCAPCSASVQNERKNYAYEAKNMCVTVGKVEFDDHTWYVFWGTLGAPAVVHNPNCKCNIK